MSKKKLYGLHTDGVMRSVTCLTQEIARQHISSGMPHIDCIFMVHSEEDKRPEERNAISLRVFWDRNQQYTVIFMGAKGDRYQGLMRIEEEEGFKVPLQVIEMYLSGEFIDTSRRTILERLRFNRLMGALQEIHDAEVITKEEGLKTLAHSGIPQLKMVA